MIYTERVLLPPGIGKLPGARRNVQKSPDLPFALCRYDHSALCRRGDLNPHALAGTSPSSWRVYLFRHFDVGPGHLGRDRL
jgi:hypothetical protein